MNNIKTAKEVPLPYMVSRSILNTFAPSVTFAAHYSVIGVFFTTPPYFV